MSYPLYLVDAFANGPFTGNPAAVVILDGPADACWMQRVAMEMNQAETAFLVPQGDAFGLRWFTPAVEVDLCGHATLASAHALFESGYSGDDIRFETRSGILTASRADQGYELDFPAELPISEAMPFPIACLPSEPVWTGRNRMDWFVQLESACEVRHMQPDFAEIARLGIRGLIVTAPGDEAFDFVSRCYFPQSGVDEDAVTGSAHCALAAYWTPILGKPVLTGYQASRRGGIVTVELQSRRVKLRGAAITTVKGSLVA